MEHFGDTGPRVERDPLCMRRLEDFKPMLVAERPLRRAAPPGWIYELKYHGYRLTAAFGEGVVQLRTRNGANATKWFPEIADSLAEVKGGLCITDGEVCVLDEYGRSNFEALQERARHRCWYLRAKPVVYCVFDLLVDRGVDITAQPLMLRKLALERLFREPLWGIHVVAYSDKGVARLFKEGVVPPDLEEIIAKRRSSIYLPGVRTPEWVTVKVKRQGAMARRRLRSA
jgi:bifunctional non-homologous end joining protein LigD